MPADREEIDDALREGMRIQFLTAPVRMLGDKGRVAGLECVRTELKDADASGRRKPVPVEGSEFVLKADSIISAVGQQSDYEVLGSYAMDRESRGTRESRGMRESLGTKEKSVFVAGDFVDGRATVVEAMASGKKAAEAVVQYLEAKDK